MEFQNPSIHESEVILCIKSGTDARTDARTTRKQYVVLISSKLRA